MGVENTSGDPSTACVLGGRVKSSFDHFDGCTEKVVTIVGKKLTTVNLINVNSKRKLFGPKEPALLLMLHSANDDLVNRLTQTKRLLIDMF